MLLCFACVETLCALELVHQSDVSYSIVCYHSNVLCYSACARRSGIVVSRFLAAAAACVILLGFAAENRKLYCSGCMKVANGALAVFFHFGADDFLFKIPNKTCFKIVFFLLMCRDPVLELQFVQNSIAFRNSVSADRNLRPGVDDES